MRQFAGFAEEAEGAIEKEDYSTFADLMEKVLYENIYSILKCDFDSKPQILIRILLCDATCTGTIVSGRRISR